MNKTLVGSPEKEPEDIYRVYRENYLRIMKRIRIGIENSRRLR
jgi:hypothetical protein